MQKFTVFSIILSVSVVLILGDIVFHDYLSAWQKHNPETPEGDAESSSEAVIDNTGSDSFLDETGSGSGGLVPGESGSGSESMIPNSSGSESTSKESVSMGEEPEGTGRESEEAWVQLSEEIGNSVLQPNTKESDFMGAGFSDPVLKEAVFTGLIFQMISFSDQVEAYIYKWNLFEGEDFVGTVHEIKYPSEMGSLQGYLNLRERAFSQAEMGEVNEVNNYGDASFYFNHSKKTKTVHSVIRSGRDVYTFQYAYSMHDKMKKLFEYGL